MNKQLTVLGGGSPFTAAFVDALAAAAPRLTPRRLVLQGREAARLAPVVLYAQNRLRPLGWEVCGSISPADSLAGAEIVIHQIRYGGLEGRARGEELCAKHRVPADETLGPAALLTALHLRSELEETCRLLRTHAPGACVWNLTNPLSCVTALMCEFGVADCLGLCELPSVTADQIARRLDVPPGELDWSYTGLNHRGFVHAISSRGRPRLADLIERLGAEALAGVEPVEIARMQAVPLKYFMLLRSESPFPPPRAQFLGDLRQRILSELAANPGISPPSLRERYLEWYSHSVVPLLAAWESPQPTRHVVNRWSGDGLVREHAALVNRDGLTPIAAPPLPHPAEGWQQRFELHERLFLAAVRGPSRERLREVLNHDPLVPPGAAAPLTDEIWSAYSQACRQRSAA
jgi:6-phospho-beta-glucosidase